MPCQAQSDKSTQYGIIAGLNLTNLYTNDAVSNINAGFNAGGFIRLPVTNSIAIEPELYVSTKGSSMTYNSLLVNGTANFNLTYLEMPVIAVFNMTKLVNLQVGPYVSYLIDGKVKNVANVTLFNFEQNLNVNDYNRLDAGIVVGVGLDVRTVTMGMRYNLGLINVGKTQQFLGTSYNIPNAMNGVINFYVAIGFNQNIK
jgi:hypothetical protein